MASDITLEECWVCLSSAGTLTRPCACPRSVHATCLARWQLQQTGKQEEECCRFCYQKLPNWVSTLVPAPPERLVTPVMAIQYNGKIFKIRVKPGPDGLQHFQQQVRELLGFEITEDFDVSFECLVPQTGEKVTLSGLRAYGAATQCAAVTAAQRVAQPCCKPLPTIRSHSAPSTSTGYVSAPPLAGGSTPRREGVSTSSGYITSVASTSQLPCVPGATPRLSFDSAAAVSSLGGHVVARPECSGAGAPGAPRSPAGAVSCGMLPKLPCLMRQLRKSLSPLWWSHRSTSAGAATTAGSVQQS